MAGLALDRITFLCSSLMAVSLAVSTFCSIMALKSGTMILSSLFSTAGLFVPCIAGVFLFDERVSALQFAGLIVFICAAYLLIGCSRQIYKQFSAKTLILLIGSMLSNGTTMLAQKCFSEYNPTGNAGAFNLYAFLLSAVLSAFLFMLFKSKNKEQPTFISKKIMWYGVALSCAVFIISQVSTIAAKTVQSIILFPLSNGGGMIICAIVSAIAFKERLNIKSIFGIAFGIASLMIINFG